MNSKTKRQIPFYMVIVCILLWIGIWQLVAVLINNDIFLPSPIRVIQELITLIPTTSFWAGIGYSLLRIVGGFFIGFILGVICAILAHLHPFLEAFFNIPMKVIRAIPVASFIILALLWVEADGLTLLITACMVTPIIYTHTLAGLHIDDPHYIAVGKLYRISRLKTLRYIEIPAMLPALCTAASTASGFAFKSGVAAEVIAQIRFSIGNYLYQSKIYLETPALFAWTIAIILLSLGFEKLIIFLIRRLQKIVS